MRSRSPRLWLLACAECPTDCVNARRPSRAAARLRCVGCLWPHGCSGRRRARPLCVPVGGGPPASRPRCELRSARRLEARPGPATAHRHRGQALRTLRRPPHQWGWVAVNSPARPRHRPRAPQPGPTARVSCSALACGMAEAMPNFARNSPATISNLEFKSLELQRFLTLLTLHPIELRATFLGAWPFLHPRVPQQASAPPSQFRMQFLRGCFMV